MEGETGEDKTNQSTIAFGGMDEETAEKYMRAFELVGIKTDGIEARIGAEINGGQEVSI